MARKSRTQPKQSTDTLKALSKVYKTAIYLSLIHIWKVYYDIVNSGERIKELRAARRMTRQQLAEQIGLSVDALREIEAGVNGAKIDTLISIAELFHISLRVYLHLCKNRKN